MHPYEYIFSFRLRHPNQDITTLFRKLSEIPGIKPGRIWKAGDPRQTPKGTKLDGYYSESSCGFSFFDAWQNSDREELPDAIERILEKLSPFKIILNEFSRNGGTLELFVGLSVDRNSGVIFDPDLLKKLGDFEIQLEFDLYPPDKT